MHTPALLPALLLGCGEVTSPAQSTPATPTVTWESDADTDADTDTDTDADTDADSDADTDTDPMCDAAGEIVAAAQALLGSLDSEQTEAISFSMDDPERLTWSNLPPLSVPRQGLPLSEMTDEQDVLALALLGASLSGGGLEEAEGIIALEAEAEAGGDRLAQGDLYYFGIFDTPGLESPWGWQLDGHHLAMSFTAVGCIFTMTPTLYGVSPATTDDGFAPLGDEVSLAEDLIRSLTEEQLTEATLTIPPELQAGPDYDGGLAYDGLAVSALTAEQLLLLDALIEAYVQDQEGAFADWKMAEVREEYDQTFLGFIGLTDGSADIYYRVHGPGLLIEFDHVNSGSRDHIHAVYRDPRNDYGADLLAEHYQKFPH